MSISPVESAVSAARSARRLTLTVRLLAVAAGGLGLALLVPGVWPARLGGSWYRLACGAAYLSAAGLLGRGRPSAVWLLSSGLAATVAWALWEVVLDFWPLVPRLVLPALIALPGLLLLPRHAGDASGRRGRAGPAAGVILCALLATLVAEFFPHGEVIGASAANWRAPSAHANPGDFTRYARGGDGKRLVASNQVSRANVSQLAVAWTCRTGDIGKGEGQNVPMQIGSTVYTCSRNDYIAALNADTGAVLRRYEPSAYSGAWQRFRGHGYHDASRAPASNHACTRYFQTSAPTAGHRRRAPERSVARTDGRAILAQAAP